MYFSGVFRLNPPSTWIIKSTCCSARSRWGGGGTHVCQVMGCATPGCQILPQFQGRLLFVTWQRQYEMLLIQNAPNDWTRSSFFVLLAPHRGIRKVVFKKLSHTIHPWNLTQSCLHSIRLLRLFHTAYAFSQNARDPDRVFLQTTLLISRILRVKIKILFSSWWRLELVTSAIMGMVYTCFLLNMKFSARFSSQCLRIMDVTIINIDFMPTCLSGTEQLAITSSLLKHGPFFRQNKTKQTL